MRRTFIVTCALSVAIGASSVIESTFGWLLNSLELQARLATLRAIADGGRDAYYGGPIGAEIVGADLTQPLDGRLQVVIHHDIVIVDIA